MQTALLGEALDNGPVLVFVADESMRYVAVNRLACDVLGYTREELLALRVTDVATSDEARDEFASMLEKGTQRGRAELRHRDGSTVTVDYFAEETTIAGLAFYVAVGTLA